MPDAFLTDRPLTFLPRVAHSCLLLPAPPAMDTEDWIDSFGTLDGEEEDAEKQGSGKDNA